jgi:hypothetical protein
MSKCISITNGSRHKEKPWLSGLYLYLITLEEPHSGVGASGSSRTLIAAVEIA